MAETAVAFLQKILGKLLVFLFWVMCGAENELKQLQEELGIMKACLTKESGNKIEKDGLSRDFEASIRDVLYEAEDIIESCLILAAAENQKNWLEKVFNPKKLSLANDVKCLREKIKVRGIIDKIDKVAVNSANDRQTAGASNTSSKITPTLRKDIVVVGFENMAETIINCLKEKSEELEVLSIIGMPGLGKTTLAWKIYQDPRIQCEFPILIWVYVSQEFNMKDVLLTILKNFTHDKMSSNRRDVLLTILKKFTLQDMSSKIDDDELFQLVLSHLENAKFHQDMSNKTDDNELVQLVRLYLKNAKFLLFIDDVWTPEVWNIIKAVLPNSNGSAKVLITSRMENVAWEANIKGLHRLDFLNLDQSWQLLQLKVFDNLNDCPSELEYLGKDIAKQCGGLPLAIEVIGGILKKLLPIAERHERKKQWRRVADSVSGHFTDDKEKRAENFISMSYDHLPDDLKICFIYLGVFPKDFEILVWKLICLWIAEGFIQKKPGNSLEEVAEDHVKDLIRMNLVMLVKTKVEGGIKTIRVHSMIREFCKNEAEKQNLFQEMKKSKEGVLDVSDIEKYRRLSLHSNFLNFLQKKPNGKHVRSFLYFSKEAIKLPSKNIPHITDVFNCIRVLDATPIKFSTFPTKLNELSYLRYIALSGDEFKVLPKEISKLWNLQTIIVYTTSPTLEIKYMWKMMQLRHFKTKAALIVNKPGKDDNAEYLQTLSRLSAECCTPDVFNKAQNLKTLGIRGNLATVFNANCLQNLECLEELKLVYYVLPDEASKKPLLSKTLKDCTFPPNLRILTLSAAFLDSKDMSALGMIDSLEVLKLKNMAFERKRWDITDGAFPSLLVLHIAGTDLELWTASNDAFPKLSRLVLKECKELEEIPSGVVKSLEILDIERVTKSAVASARNIQKENQRMQIQQRSKRGGFKLLIAPGDES